MFLTTDTVVAVAAAAVAQIAKEHANENHKETTAKNHQRREG